MLISKANQLLKKLEEMQGKEIDGRPINLDMSTGKPHASKSNNDRAKQYGDSQSPPSDTLFIGNLSFNANRDNLFNVLVNMVMLFHAEFQLTQTLNNQKGSGTFNSPVLMKPRLP